MRIDNYYKLLNVSVNATTAEIEAAYEHRVNEKALDSSMLPFLAEAKKVLTDPVARMQYDVGLIAAQDRILHKSALTFFNAAQNTDKLPAVNLPTAIIFTGAPAKYGSYKAVLLGSTESKKSEFLLNLFPEAPKSMIGVDCRTYTVSDTCKINIFDTAGQERFRTVTDSYYRDAAVVLVFDDAITWANDFFNRTNREVKGMQAFVLSYDNNQVLLKPVDNLQITAGTMQSFDAETAKQLGVELFSQCESRLVGAVQTYDASILSLDKEKDEPAETITCCGM